MTPRQIDLVRSSFALVEPIADTAAQIFYRRLWDLDPSVRSLFTATDMAGQRRSLMQTLGVVVRGLDRLDTIVPAVEALGRRHVGYGVRPFDYETVGGALLDTLEEGLGDAFTAETRQSWAAAYGLLADAMQAAAAKPTVDATPPAASAA